MSHVWATLREKGPDQLQFWLIALLIGIAAGYAAIGFRLAISLAQTALYGADDVRLASVAERIEWYWIVLIPIVGGLIVGQILHRMTDDGRARSVAHVIESAAVREGRVEIRFGLASAFASLVTLSTGGSSGREGPVVHLGAVISSFVSNRINADAITARDLLGCAVAAAVSASFNAPIAGALFALEVILRHFALHAFAPIVIASVAGTVVSRWHMGDVTEFLLPERLPGFYAELPAFLILGGLCGLVAVVMMRSIFLAEALGTRFVNMTGMPRWLRPAVSGAVLGIIAVWFPHIIGVGYETTSRALTGDLGIGAAILFAIVKVIAVAVTMGGRMGGGIFSPALMVGALTGLAFGYVAVGLFPALSGSETLYAMAGMGSVAAAVLGAPISTTLIVFELTGDWQAGIAVMVSVSLSSALAGRIVDRSFFLSQLEMRGVRVAGGPQDYLPATLSVRWLMKSPATDEAGPDIADMPRLVESDTLEKAFPLFESAGVSVLPVMSGTEVDATLIGYLHEVDAYRAYTRALERTAAEEHS